MIKERKSIVGVYENILFAEAAKRELKTAGITSTILNYPRILMGPISKQQNNISLAVPFEQIDEAKKILKIKFK